MAAGHQLDLELYLAPARDYYVRSAVFASPRRHSSEGLSQTIGSCGHDRLSLIHIT
jgi:hypothetical protein